MRIAGVNINCYSVVELENYVRTCTIVEYMLGLC